METPKTVKIGRMGSEVKEIIVSPNTTVREALANAEYVDIEEIIYGEKTDGETEMVSQDANVNGYTMLVISSNVKGGTY